MSVSTESFAIDFARLVDSQPNATAVVVGGSLIPRTITYASLDTLIERCIHEFIRCGLVPGGTVLALMPNSAEAFVAFLACIKGGYGFAPLPCTATRREVQSWIGLVKPGLCVATQLVADDLVATLSENRVPVVRTTLGGDFEWLPNTSVRAVVGGQSRIYLSTSGTTGDPKAMVLDGDRLWASGRAFMRFHRLQGSRLRFWNYLPMSYLGGLYNLGLIPLCVGGSTVIDESFSGRTFVQFWQTVERFEIDAIWFVPTIVRGLVKLAERMQVESLRSRSKRIRTAFLGTAPIDLATKRQFETMFGLSLLENFALSETTFLSSEVEGKLNQRVEGSVGEILPYAELKFVPVAPGEPACAIYAKSPFLFLGYLSNDGKIDAPLDDDGYLPTGDLGHLTEDKQLVIDGRTRDIIKKAGNLVSLREVEVLAETHEAVQEAAAVPVPHDFYGESYVIFVILKPGYSQGSIADVSSFIHESLVKYKWPETLMCREDFPRTASGKVRKRKLADELASLQ